MTLFGERLSEIESKLLKNAKKTKGVFPEDTELIETGLELMTKLTKITNENFGDLWKKPNLATNINLFARNRQLLLNAYLCALHSSYGTQFVILRTVLENNNLMRHFNDNHRHAFEWLSQEMQERFSKEVRSRYGNSKHDREFKPSFVRESIFKGKLKVKRDIGELYDSLCDYSHPNFRGWHELFGLRDGKTEIILKTPYFQPNNSEKSIALTIFLMQLSFKTFYETFREYLDNFKHELAQWQVKYKSLILRYCE